MEKQASDLHIKTGSAPHIRVNGELAPVDSIPPSTKAETLDLAQHLLNARQREILAEKSEVDLSFGVEGLGRFRVALFHQRGSISMVFRLIPDEVLSLQALQLPEVLTEIAGERRGLILVTGTTGSGKSTTLASMINHINKTRRSHVITIEDPIEFLMRDNLAFISQREVAIDTSSFASALRSALRQDPDVIMVGEMRDLETVQIAMQAAETGHLVMSTLHTTDAIETVHRIISVFPTHQQHDIRLQLASVLNAIISMRLIRSSISGGRIPAVEILRNTELVRSLISQAERTKEIKHALETGGTQYGMQSFDQSIFEHHQKGVISTEDALQNATSPQDLKLRIQGIVSSSDEA